MLAKHCAEPLDFGPLRCNSVTRMTGALAAGIKQRRRLGPPINRSDPALSRRCLTRLAIGHPNHPKARFGGRRQPLLRYSPLRHCVNPILDKAHFVGIA